MQHHLLTHMVSQFFDTLPADLWHDKRADQIQGQVPHLGNQGANTFLRDFILPARVAQIEQSAACGQVVGAGCQPPFPLHQRGTATTLKTICGASLALRRQQSSCPRCDRYQMVAEPVVAFGGPRLTPR